jgi:hypothetical protein
MIHDKDKTTPSVEISPISCPVNYQDDPNKSIQTTEHILLDSAASHSIVRDPSYLIEDSFTAERSSIGVADSNRMEVVGTGAMRVPLQCMDGTIMVIEVTNVLVCPSMDTPWILSYHDLLAFLVDNDKDMVIRGSTQTLTIFSTRTNGPPPLNLLNDLPSSARAIYDSQWMIHCKVHETGVFLPVTKNAVRGTTRTVSKIGGATRLRWHQRIGHASNAFLSNLLRHVPELKVLKADPVPTSCEINKIANMKRRPHRGKARVPLPRSTWHVDTVGFKIKDTEGISTTTHVLVFQNYLSYTHVEIVDNLQETTIYRAVDRASNLLEMTSYIPDGFLSLRCQSIEDMLERKGCVMAKCPPRSSAFSGRVEAAHRTIIQRARSIHLAANCPTWTFAFAVLHANYLHNICVPLGDTVSPFKKQFNADPDFNGMRVFGCKAVVHYSEYITQSHKHEPRARMGVYLGCAQYDVRLLHTVLLLDQDKPQVVYSQNVDFLEHAMAFTPTESNTLFSPCSHTVKGAPSTCEKESIARSKEKEEMPEETEDSMDIQDGGEITIYETPDMITNIHKFNVPIPTHWSPDPSTPPPSDYPTTPPTQNTDSPIVPTTDSPASCTGEIDRDPWELMQEAEVSSDHNMAERIANATSVNTTTTTTILEDAPTHPDSPTQLDPEKLLVRLEEMAQTACDDDPHHQPIRVHRRRMEEEHGVTARDLRAVLRDRVDLTDATIFKVGDSEFLPPSSLTSAHVPTTIRELLQHPERERVMDGIVQEWNALLSMEGYMQFNHEMTKDERKGGIYPTNSVLVNSYKKLEKRNKSRWTITGNRIAQHWKKHEVSSPTIHLQTIRSSLALAARRGLPVETLDISTAYLTSSLGETTSCYFPSWIGNREVLTYILTHFDGSLISRMSPAVVHFFRQVVKGDISDAQFKTTVRKLVLSMTRSQYGHPLSGSAFYDHLCHSLEEMGAKQCAQDPCAFYFEEHNVITLICLIYVDDCLLIECVTGHMIKFREEFTKLFKCRLMGTLANFLGTQYQVSDNNRSIVTLPFSYINATLQEYGYADIKASLSPMVEGIVLSDNTDNGTPVEATPYRGKVGRILFNCRTSVPEATLAIAEVGRMSHAPNSIALRAVVRIMSYLQSVETPTISYPPHIPQATAGQKTGTTLPFTPQSTYLRSSLKESWHRMKGVPNDTTVMTLFTDASFFRTGSQRNQIAFMLFQDGCLIHWNTKRITQGTFCVQDAELAALVMGLKTLQGHLQLLAQLKVKVQEPVTAMVDNAGLVTSLQGRSGGTWQNASQYANTRLALHDNKVQVVHIRTQYNVVDILTKSMSPAKFQRLLTMIQYGIFPLTAAEMTENVYAELELWLEEVLRWKCLKKEGAMANRQEEEG